MNRLPFFYLHFKGFHAIGIFSWYWYLICYWPLYYWNFFPWYWKNGLLCTDLLIRHSFAGESGNVWSCLKTGDKVAQKSAEQQFPTCFLHFPIRFLMFPHVFVLKLLSSQIEIKCVKTKKFLWLFPMFPLVFLPVSNFRSYDRYYSSLSN